jgi:hypothetical protein
MKKTIPLVLLTFLIFALFLQASEFEVKILKNAQDLPEKFCTIGKKGDYFVSDGKYLVLLGGTPRPLDYPLLNIPRSNAMGSIIGFAPAGKNIVSDLSIGSPVLKFMERRNFLSYSSLKVIEKGSRDEVLTLKASATYKTQEGKEALIETTYDILYQKGQINITSIIKNTGKQELEELDYYLHFGPHHSYYFSPFNRLHHPELHFRVYQKIGHFLGWMDLNPEPSSDEDEEPQPGLLAPGEEFHLSYILFVESQGSRLLQKIYSLLGRELETATLHFRDTNGKMMEVVIRNALSSSIFYRSFLKNADSLTIPLPQGVYLVRGNIFPAVCEEFLQVAEGEENICILKSPPLEKVKVKIMDNQGSFVPGKVTFLGLDPTKTPYFKPEDPIESGRRWELFKNSCFPPQKGLELELPVGTYLVYASRGPDYSLDYKVAEILKGKTQELVFQIDRVVERKNLISIDPHMHTLASDGRADVQERVRSVVAEGLDVAVATDHNFISDYRPALKILGLEKYLAVISGNEVTRNGLIHYNSYPLECRKEEERNGAISPLAEEASVLFEASRRKDPQALVQVNHPRDSDIGYFNNYRLDPESAAFAWTNFDTSFDLLEVMNGPCFSSSNEEAVQDWFNLLNRGYYFPIVGSSDSHTIDRGEPGYCRTYIYYGGGKGDKVDWPLLEEALRKGRSFVSNGPLVEFKINDIHGPGDLMTESKGEVRVSVEVRSAPWVSVDEVRLVVNGERKIVFPIRCQDERILKFSEEVGLSLKEDSYIVVEVLGKKSLFPVLQSQARNGRLESANLPYALTNPVFIDVDGTGRFDPPWPDKIRLSSSPILFKTREDRY